MILERRHQKKMNISMPKFIQRALHIWVTDHHTGIKRNLKVLKSILLMRKPFHIKINVMVNHKERIVLVRLENTNTYDWSKMELKKG